MRLGLFYQKCGWRKNKRIDGYDIFEYKYYENCLLTSKMRGNHMKNFVVTAAILIHENMYLCMQRGKHKHDYLAYKYEFPGGKVEPHESLEESLSRELREEMALEIPTENLNFFTSNHHDYPDFTIDLHVFTCKVDDKEFELLEHHDFIWLPKEKLPSLDWAPADIPIMKKLINEGN